MGNDVVKVCRGCGTGVTNRTQLSCKKCNLTLLTIVDSRSATGIRRSIQKVCASCGRPSRKTDRERCKTCQNSSFISINKAKRSSIFWRTIEEEKKKRKEETQEKKRKESTRKEKSMNLMLSLKKSLTDRDALEIEKKKGQLRENKDDIGDYRIV